MLTMYLNADGNYVQTKTPAPNAKYRSENVHQGVNGNGKTNAMRTPFHTKTIRMKYTIQYTFKADVWGVF